MAMAATAATVDEVGRMAAKEVAVGVEVAAAARVGRTAPGHH